MFWNLDVGAINTHCAVVVFIVDEPVFEEDLAAN
jgi:hypothetical protein